jgi:2-methylcitrate dehydratase PrpD
LETLPPNVVEAMKVYILDDLAGGLVGSRTPWAGMVLALANESAGTDTCTVFGRRERTSPSYAALVNGVMIGGFETDHIYSIGSSHPSAGSFSAALAAAESRHTSGAAFLAALAAGYEVCCRVGFAATRAVEDERGFHGPGTNSSFGAAVAAAKLLGLDAAGVLNALGIAGSHAGGLLEFHHEGAMTKRIHPGRGAQMGYECAVLASQGFTGPSTVLEGDTGFLNVYSPSPRPAELTHELGRHWHLLGVTIKSFPCHATCQAVVEGVWKFKQQHAIDPAKVEAVVIRTGGRLIEERYQDREPTTVMGAQYSLPFSTAIAVCCDAGDPRSFSQAVVDNRTVRRVALATQVLHTPGFGGAGQPTAEVTIRAGGENHSLTVTVWKGHPDNPFTYDEMAEKFRRYCGDTLPAANRDAVIDRVRDIEKVADMAGLARLMGTP